MSDYTVSHCNAFETFSCCEIFSSKENRKRTTDYAATNTLLQQLNMVGHWCVSFVCSHGVKLCVTRCHYQHMLLPYTLSGNASIPRTVTVDQRSCMKILQQQIYWKKKQQHQTMLAAEGGNFAKSLLAAIIISLITAHWSPILEHFLCLSIGTASRTI